MFERTKAFCDSFLQLGLPGFDLVIYHKGECVLRYRNGFSDFENKIEISGNVTRENIERIKGLGVDYVSSGALTHSAPIMDISLKNLHAIEA